jgi:hypothetical protein
LIVTFLIIFTRRISHIGVRGKMFVEFQRTALLRYIKICWKF